MKRTCMCLAIVTLICLTVASQPPPEGIFMYPDNRPISEEMSFNRAVPIVPDHFWATTEWAAVSTGMVWRDCNNDGFIDGFFSNGNDITRVANYVYLSRGGVLPVSASWGSYNQEYSGHCAVGDIDDNGYPDFVVSNYLGPDGFGDPNRPNLYLNTAGRLSGSPDWVSGSEYFSFSCSLGDVDNDGDLDLAVATGEAYYGYFEPDLLYLNVGGVLQSSPSWSSAVSTAAYDVVWGDVDNDGDLDLAFAYDNAGVAVFYNSGGTLESTASWTAASGQSANTLTLADIDNDGWLDLVVAFNNQLGGQGRYELYLNDGGGTLEATPSWVSSTGGYGSALAMYDYDLDGDLDLAAGRWWDRARVYENIEGKFSSEPVWRANLSTVVEELAWVDVDGDGVELLADTLPASGSKRLFYVSRSPLQSIDSILVDGSVVPINGYCGDPITGWVSLAQTPLSEVIVHYGYSFKADLTVCNWDTSNFALANTREPFVQMYADTTYGDIPLTVQFSDSSEGATQWQWDFGDGEVSTDQNPLIVYESTGFHDVRLRALLADGWHERMYRRMITTLADTLAGDSAEASGVGPICVSVHLRNSFRVNEIIIPVQYAGDVALQYASFSVAGCRTESFAIAEYKHYDTWNKRITIRLKASEDFSVPELEPGYGEVVRLYFTVQTAPSPGQLSWIDFSGYSTYTPKLYGSDMDYVPVINNGVIAAPSSCCVGIRGNVDGDSEDMIDIGDLVFFAEFSFADGPEPACFEEADIDASSELDISDIVYLVEYRFNEGPPPVSCW